MKFKDVKIQELIKKEIIRQRDGLVLIASENYASPEVLAALATPLNNKYSEGYPGKRYYGGNEFIDEIEKIAIKRAKKLFPPSMQMYSPIPVRRPTRQFILHCLSREIRF